MGEIVCFILVLFALLVVVYIAVDSFKKKQNLLVGWCVYLSVRCVSILVRLLVGWVV